MPPHIGSFTADGPSRHRLRKGLILISRDRSRPANGPEQAWVASQAAQILAHDERLQEFAVEADPAQPSLLSVATPLAAVHTRRHRDEFFGRLAQVVSVLQGVAEAGGLAVVGAGANPFVAPAEGQAPALCADVHEIEVLDDLEVNRIYNLFRQYLPELIAISAHSALHGGQLQKDMSTRMRLNPVSFTPPSLSLFSAKQLDRLKRVIVKDYGVGDLTQLDVNPISPGTITLRFVDAQASLRFIRAQLLLFQAVAVHGRSLARQGSQMPILHGRVIGENKALAIESGPAAVFKPDRRREARRAGKWYQDRKEPERASTTVLELIHHRTVEDGGNVLAALRAMGAAYEELAPWLLGCELRKRGEACLVNYGEYQMRLFYVNRAGWPAQLIAEHGGLLSDPTSDLLCEYNEKKFAEKAAQISAEWRDRLGTDGRAQARPAEHRRNAPRNQPSRDGR